MKNASICFILLSIFSSGLSAHHSHSSLSRDDYRTFTGVVTEYLWRAPHIYIKAETVMPDGEVREYAMEMGNPMSMIRNGWDKDTWQAGEQITWYGRHDRDLNRPYMSLEWAERADGTRIYQSGAAQAAYLESLGVEVDEPVQEAPVVPATEIGDGFWSRTGPDFTRFANVYGPERALEEQWPLSAKALDQIERETEAQNPSTYCVTSGPPRQLFSLGTWHWQRTEDAIYIDKDLWPQKRVIHLDPTVPAGEPSRWGHSVGYFEDGQLIVKTDNFTADEWGMYWEVGSSAQKSMQERYWLSHDGTMLNVEFTVTDPEYLTEPLTVTHQWAKLSDDRELVKAECSIEQANFFLEHGYE